jgi:phytoene/squalene synthetase
VYDVARVIDDLGDESERGRTALLLRFREDLGHTWRGEGPEEPVLRGLIPTIRTRSLELDPCHRLVRASPADQEVNRNLTEADPLSYCELSANPIGRIVLAVFGVQSAAAGRLSDLVCTALQLIEHTQDIAEERRAGRLCVPQEDLAGYGVGGAELDAATSSPAPRELVAGQALRALDLLVTAVRASLPALGSATDPVLIAVAGAARQYPIPLMAVDELLDGCGWASNSPPTAAAWPGRSNGCASVCSAASRIPAPHGTRTNSALRCSRRTSCATSMRTSETVVSTGLRRSSTPSGSSPSSKSRGALVDSGGGLSALIRHSATRARQWYADDLRLAPLLDRIADRPDLVFDRRLSLSGEEKAGVAIKVHSGRPS